MDPKNMTKTFALSITKPFPTGTFTFSDPFSLIQSSILGIPLFKYGSILPTGVLLLAIWSLRVYHIYDDKHKGQDHSSKR